MDIHSEKAKEIDAYLKSHKDAEKGKWPLEISGEKEILPFYKLPIALLTYNPSNGRLAMDKHEWEVQNNRKLDGGNPEDAKILRDMLLELDKEKTETLKLDIQKKGQMEPGVVTHDGVVINGNRRMAVIEQLHSEEPTGKWTSIEAVRLDTSVSEKDLWKIEAGLQLSKDKVAEYHPVNELLKFREGRNRGLDETEIAAAMYAWEPAEVVEALERLTLIDNFLKFFQQEGHYEVIKKFGLHEYFIDIQKRVLAPARNSVPRREQDKRLKYSFALIASHIRIKGAKEKQKGITHWDIRKLDKVFNDAHARVEFEKPLKNSSKLISAPPDEVIEGFRSAVDVLQMREEKNKPLKLIEKAIKALKSIEVESIDKEIDERICEKIATGLDNLNQEIKLLRERLD